MNMLVLDNYRIEVRNMVDVNSKDVNRLQYIKHYTGVWKPLLVKDVCVAV